MIAQPGLPAYRIRHFLRLLLLSFLEVRAARVACSKTSRTPSLVLAEHSMYSLAPIFSLTCLACVLCKSGSCSIQRVKTHLLLGDGSLRGLVKFLDSLLVVSEILLTSNEDDRKTLAEMQDLGDPLLKNKSCQHAARHVRWQFRRAAYLLLDVVEGVGRVDGETDQNDMRVRVGERAQSVVIFLASGIPEGELDVLAIDLDIGDVVLEDGGDVDL